MRLRKDKAGLGPIAVPGDLDIAWAAGIYEGEDPEFLYRLRDFFGGSVKEYRNDRGNLATLNQPFTIYAWRVCGDRARVFLSVIYSYLTSRRKAQIDATPVRAFLDIVGSVPRNGALQFVEAILKQHVELNRELAKLKRIEYQKKFYERQQLNPDFVEKRRLRMRNFRQRAKVVSIA